MTTLMLFCAASVLAAPAEVNWQAGAAKVVITPTEPLWMSGYSSRDKPSEGALHDLWTKALVLVDPAGGRVALVTLDLCGIDRALADRIKGQLADKYGLPPERVALCCSHTHTGPVVGDNLRAMYFLDDEQQRRVAAYTVRLESAVVEAVGRAIDDLSPAAISWGNGQATFAVNRRNNREADVPKLRAEGKLAGPVDHQVPVLAVRAAVDGHLRAIAFGYACHATVLSFYQFSGDWPGFAQIELEQAHPGAVALFWAGCGADQNPLPRRTVELAAEYGRQAARAVDDVLGAPMSPIGGSLSVKLAHVELPFANVPTHEQLVADSSAADKYEASRARLLLAAYERIGRIASTYPYPVQTWQLGDGPSWVLLGGEVVVDYSLRLAAEHRPGRTWVAGYANDVMAYIPSRRVLVEGGYEGGGAMVYYGLPSPWALPVEELIVGEVHRQLAGQ